jgi:hypothetical protein
MKRLLLLLIVAGCGFCPGAAPITGSKTCPSSGNTPILATGVNTAQFTILSLVANTGAAVYIGGANVTTSNGLQLLPGQSYTPSTQGNAQVYNLGQVYLACANTTDTVRYVYY